MKARLLSSYCPRELENLGQLAMQIRPLISRYLRRRAPAKNAILVSKARSGTNYFLDVYANSVPNSTSFREIFRPTGDSFLLMKKTLGLEKGEYLECIKDDPLRIWLRLEEISQKSGQRFMAKIFYDHATGHPELWEYFRDRNQVIHLIRRNPFDSLVSFNVANQTGKWLQAKSTEPPSMPKPFALPRAKVETYITQAEKHIKATRAFFGDAKYSEVFYEDISTSVQRCAATICDILQEDAATAQAKTRMHKQKNYTNQSIVSNYDEVCDLDRYFF